MNKAATQPQRTRVILFGDGAKGARFQIWETSDPLVFLIAKKANHRAPWETSRVDLTPEEVPEGRRGIAAAVMAKLGLMREQPPAPANEEVSDAP